MHSYFETLQVAPNAEPEVIKAAFRALALKYHPDRLPPDATAEEREAANRRMARLNEALAAATDHASDPHRSDPNPNPSSKAHRSEVRDSPPESFEAALKWFGYWKAMAAWGRDTQVLPGKERSFVFNLGRLIDSGNEPSQRQEKWARDIWNRVSDDFGRVLFKYLKTA